MTTGIRLPSKKECLVYFDEFRLTLVILGKHLVWPPSGAQLNGDEQSHDSIEELDSTSDHVKHHMNVS